MVVGLPLGLSFRFPRGEKLRGEVRSGVSPPSPEASSDNRYTWSKESITRLKDPDARLQQYPQCSTTVSLK